MGKKTPVPNPQCTDEFKLEAVRLAESIGGNQAVRRLGIPNSSLWNWIRLSRAGKLAAGESGTVPVKRSASELEAEAARLRQVERVHQLCYDLRAQARLDIVDWIEGFYNRQRMHSAINYQIPVAAVA